VRPVSKKAGSEATYSQFGFALAYVYNCGVNMSSFRVVEHHLKIDI
jgi:hypothetical protein